MASALSIEEANKLRASLGMPLLPVPGGSSNLNFKPTSSAGAAEEDLGSTLESREAAGFDNWKRVQNEAEEKGRREARKAAIRKERDAAQRNRQLEGKGLADLDDDGVDTRSWLLSQKKRQKKIAKDRTEQLRLDLEERERQAEYTEQDLAGKQVGHELGAFEDDGEVILTLKDTAVDAEDEDDELENVHFREKEKLAQKLELKKKKPIYDPNAIDDSGDRSVLAQYDEEIEGKKSKHFTLNDQGSLAAHTKGDDTVSDPRGTRFSLDFLIEDKPTSDYMDISEIKIRKPKKKKDKLKKRKAASDDDENVPHLGPDAAKGDQMQMEEPAQVPPKRTLADTSFVDDEDLQLQLAQSRRSALKKRKVVTAEDLARQLREESSANPRDTVEEEEGGLVIDETSEFVSNLQAPEPAQRRRSSATNRVKEEPQDSPLPDQDGDTAMDQYHNKIGYGEGGDEDVAAHAKRESSSAAAEQKVSATGLDEEGTLNQGVGAALAMLTQRGLLKTADSGDVNAMYRERQRFLAEKARREEEAERRARSMRERDRASGRFDRMSVRERETHAQQENQQRDQQESRKMAEIFNKEYKPNIDLKYVDDFGRHMNQKEAFKHLSHQFHGKGSGAQKTEKKLKKVDDEKKKEAMSSLDSSQSAGINSAMGQTAKKNRQAGVRLQ